MDAGQFLDEFRPFRRGEIALARRSLQDPLLLPPLELDLLRYAIRLAQLSSIRTEADGLVHRVGSFRLRLLQLLAPVLPTEPDKIDAHDLHALLPRVAMLVEEARTDIVGSGLCGLEELDDEVSQKRLVVVLGGAAGSGYVFLGALDRLEEMGIVPSYMVGCSMGSLLGVVRARRRRFRLPELFEEVDRIRREAVLRPPSASSRFGLPAPLRLDLRRALGPLFSHPDGAPLRLEDLEIPTDALATGLGPGALARPRAEYASLVDARIDVGAGRAKLGGGALTRLVSGLVSMAMSRRVLVPVLLGADPETSRMAALDAAGFSSAIPMLLHYDLPPEDREGASVLDARFSADGIVALVDGALASLIPARFAWDAIESGRIGSRNTLIVALDAMASARGANAFLAPFLRVTSATAYRDRAFWDLRVVFRRTPPLLELFPPPARLRRAVERGRGEFEPSARLLRVLLEPLPPWSAIRRAVPAAR